MDAKIGNLLTIETEYSKMKAAKLIEDIVIDSLFLQLPVEWQNLIDEIVVGRRPIKKLLDHAIESGMVRVPEDSHLIKEYRPLFEILPNLYRRGVKVYCCQDKIVHDTVTEILDEILLLTIRARLGKIEPRKWRALLEEEARIELELAEKCIMYILTKAKNKNLGIDLSREVLESLKVKGFFIYEITLDSPSKPLDLLKFKIKQSLLKGKEVSDEEIIHYVKEHVQFTELIMRYGFDDAYRIWTGSKKC
ncbi:MAG: hypothetical protein H5T50_08490 [Nitrososphaeria archaeon]|nr:hypothetical protein [Nitrososphaeria archaeon]